MNTMRGMLRRFITIVTAAAVVGTIAALIAHGAFDAMMTVLYAGLAAAFVLLIVAALLQPWRRTNAVAVFVGRCMIVVIVAIPAAWIAARGVVAIEWWNAKRYVMANVLPRLEGQRRLRGRYPKRMPVPNGAPWLVERIGYVTDGQRYTLTVPDVGVCGHGMWYSSATRQWTETHDPCWF